MSEAEPTVVTIARCPSCGARAEALLQDTFYKQVCGECGHEVWGVVTETIAEVLREASRPPP